MNCISIAEQIPKLVSGELPPILRADCEQHIRRCPDCRDALQGARSLALLRGRDTGDVPAGLMGRISRSHCNAPASRLRGSFWLGSGFGGALAASLLTLALSMNWVGPADQQGNEIAEFIVALSEPRNMDIAIETDRALADANISILLSGGIELDGYGHRRELSWTTDLEAGVNRLSLPVLAVHPAGGQMIVRLDHPNSEQVFVVRLDTEA